MVLYGSMTEFINGAECFLFGLNIEWERPSLVAPKNEKQRTAKIL